jgi:hypothetical protein
MPLHITAHRINDVVPTITAIETPTHSSLRHGCMTVTENLWVLFTQSLVKFFFHIESL